MTQVRITEKRLDEPTYPAAEAARLVGLSTDRVKRWLRGYSYHYDSKCLRQNPVIHRSGSADNSYASFLDLIDLLFAKRFVDQGISLQRLRKALDESASILKTTHFARQSFFTDGKNIYLEVSDEGDAILELLSGGQWVIPDLIKKLAQQIDFDSRLELARRWYPLGLEGLVVLDPLFSFGKPTIVGKGVTTANVYDFYIAEDEQVRPTCRWLGLTQNEVRAAIRFEAQLVA